MEPSELGGDKAWPHVGLVDNQGRIGTGFVVKDRYALTASHVVRGASIVHFRLEDETFDAEVIKDFEDKDIALLRLSSEFHLVLPPLPLGELPTLPVAYKTWGYRVVEKLRLMQGYGNVRARLSDGSLQLETQTQRPGMSGCPLAIGGKGGWRVVAIGSARFNPETFQDEEHLGFAYPVVPLPAEVIEFLGTLVTSDIDEPVENAAAALEKMLTVNQRAKSRARMARNICVIALLAVFSILLFLRVDPLNLIPVLAILIVGLFHFQIESRELGKATYVARSLSPLLRSADSTGSVPQGFRDLLEALK